MKDQKAIKMLLLMGLALSSLGCAGFYHDKTFQTPEYREAHGLERIIPVEKLLYPGATAVAGTFIAGEFAVRKCEPDYSAVFEFPYWLTLGMINTTFDTGINLFCWPFLEIYELGAGDTWDRPYTPFIKALMDYDKMKKEEGS